MDDLGVPLFFGNIHIHQKLNWDRFTNGTPLKVSCETELLDSLRFRAGVRDPWVRPLEISWNIATENGCLEYDCFVL